MILSLYPWHLKPTINFNQQEKASKLPSELEKALSFLEARPRLLKRKKRAFASPRTHRWIVSDTYVLSGDKRGQFTFP
jgi:hypothetical protein